MEGRPGKGGKESPRNYELRTRLCSPKVGGKPEEASILYSIRCSGFPEVVPKQKDLKKISTDDWEIWLILPETAQQHVQS